MRRLLDEERDTGVGHGVAGQRANAEQRQQAQMDVADRGEGGHLRAVVHDGQERLELAEVGRPSPVTRCGEVQPEAVHRLCRRGDEIGVRLQTEVGARDEFHGLAAVGQRDPLAISRGDDMPGQALLEGPIERVRGLADPGRHPVGPARWALQGRADRRVCFHQIRHPSFSFVRLVVIALSACALRSR